MIFFSGLHSITETIKKGIGEYNVYFKEHTCEIIIINKIDKKYKY